MWVIHRRTVCAGTNRGRASRAEIVSLRINNKGGRRWTLATSGRVSRGRGMRKGSMGKGMGGRGEETSPSRARRRWLTKRTTVVLRVRDLGGGRGRGGSVRANGATWGSSRRLARVLIGGITHSAAMAAVVGVGRGVYWGPIGGPIIRIGVIITGVTMIGYRCHCGSWRRRETIVVDVVTGRLGIVGGYRRATTRIVELNTGHRWV